jgi:hypothetical protein
MEKFKSLIKSRRFQAATIGLIVIISSHFGMELSQTELISITTIVSSWIFGDTIRETK